MTRSRRRRAKQSHHVLRKQCSTLLEDEQTACSKLIEISQPRCIPHQREYVTLTKEYKRHAELADSLDVFASTTSRAWKLLQSSEEVQEKIGAIDKLIETLSLEINGRKTHHKRFFNDNDAGHAARITIQEGKMAKAARARITLNARLEALLQEESIRQDLERERALSAIESSTMTKHSLSFYRRDAETHVTETLSFESCKATRYTIPESPEGTEGVRASTPQLSAYQSPRPPLTQQPSSTTYVTYPHSQYIQRSAEQIPTTSRILPQNPIPPTQSSPTPVSKAKKVGLTTLPCDYSYSKPSYPSRAIPSIHQNAYVSSVPPASSRPFLTTTYNGFTPYSNPVLVSPNNSKPPTSKSPLLPLTNADVTTQSVRGYSATTMTQQYQPTTITSQPSPSDPSPETEDNILGVLCCFVTAIFCLYCLFS
ncbi:hypothetical protein QCA50_010993 [Cerrena zonata]|uniref:Uncharacterized protein n=1 Tax=Cerrena zonata TaxID=2478898 RepID=A0AAW0G1T6_9APHY